MVAPDNTKVSGKEYRKIIKTAQSVIFRRKVRVPKRALAHGLFWVDSIKDVGLSQIFAGCYRESISRFSALSPLHRRLFLFLPSGLR